MREFELPSAGRRVQRARVIMFHHLQLAELGGTLVWRVVASMYSSGRILQRGGPEKSHPGISRRLERESSTFCLDRYGGIDHGKAISLPANVGEDSTGCTLPRSRKKSNKDV